MSNEKFFIYIDIKCVVTTATVYIFSGVVTCDFNDLDPPNPVAFGQNLKRNKRNKADLLSRVHFDTNTTLNSIKVVAVMLNS